MHIGSTGRVDQTVKNVCRTEFFMRVWYQKNLFSSWQTKKTVKSRQTKKNKFLLLELEFLMLMLELITRQGKTFPMCKAQKKVKAHTSLRPRQTELILVSLASSMPWSSATPPGRVASPSESYTPTDVTDTHLYTWVKRDKVE